ncbi:MAG: response regulator [Oceanipulchritudo sp.]
MSKPILLIDDEEKFAQMLQELLELNGYESDYCLNPEEALVRLRHENYDLVITDYMMPQMDGAQFLQAARKINPDMPVIMISGLMNMPELIKVANIGVTLVLEKPFKTEDLMQYVARFVHKKGDGKPNTRAHDAEASEISFQQESVNVTYPVPANHVSDATMENKRFLESLWTSANTCRHLPFCAQRGAEVRLVAKEVMEWTENDPAGEVVRIDLADTETDITRKWAVEVDPFPGALLVDLRDLEWNERSRALLAGWVRFLETSGKDLSMSRILYVFPTGTDFDLNELDLPEELKGVFSPECPVLLSLRERLLDTATYLNRLMDPQTRSSLGKEGLVRLLHHPWHGGYVQLQERLAALSKRLEENGQLPVDSVKEVLGQDGDEAAASPEKPDPDWYLKRRQRDYILLHQEKGEDLKDTILRLGIDSASVKVDDVLEGRQLAFPGLLRNSNKEG